MRTREYCFHMDCSDVCVQIGFMKTRSYVLLQCAVKCASSAVFSTWISHIHHKLHDNVSICGVLVGEKHQQIPPHTTDPCTLPCQPPWTLHTQNKIRSGNLHFKLLKHRFYFGVCDLSALLVR